jgi:uncharacterized membrane protein
MSQSSQSAHITAAETMPIPLSPATRRLESIDILRGLLMLLMAIDHTRDYFTSASGFDPTDPMRSWPALYATRWVTHLCAPGFIALAGTSVYLQRHRGKTRGQMTKLLMTRGLWLMVLEITVISFGWSFAFGPGLQVIWAIGVSMIFLGLLQRLPTLMIGIIGAAIVALHNLTDGIAPARFGDGAIFWTLLHVPGLLFVHHRLIGVAAYPIIPWIGVICLGYAFGPIVTLGPAHRQRLVTMLGVFLLFAFTMLRLAHGYGDHFRFQHLATPTETAMSFLEVEKYPPSLQYVLATFGVLLLLYALFDLAVSRDWLARLRGFVEVYGRVPFFYYVLHIYMLHALALGLTAYLHMNWRFWLVPGAVFIGHLNGWGFGLPVVYLIWALVVLSLYFPCLWFSRVKARRRDWWLSYL